MPNRLTDAFEEYGMAVVKNPVKAEQDVKLEKLRDERAATRTVMWQKNVSCKHLLIVQLTWYFLYLFLPCWSIDFVQSLKNHINVL